MAQAQGSNQQVSQEEIDQIELAKNRWALRSNQAATGVFVILAVSIVTNLAFKVMDRSKKV